jgi:hypothetical protein
MTDLAETTARSWHSLMSTCTSALTPSLTMTA